MQAGQLYTYIKYFSTQHILMSVIIRMQPRTMHNVIVNFLVLVLVFTHKTETWNQTHTSINTISVYACLHMATHQSRMLSKILYVWTRCDMNLNWTGGLHYNISLCVCVQRSLFQLTLSLWLWPNIEAHLKGACITLIFSVCLIERSFQMATWWPPLSSLFPFAQSCMGRQKTGSTFFANRSFCHGILISWPKPWVWLLKNTTQHNQTGQVSIAAWLHVSGYWGSSGWTIALD